MTEWQNIMNTLYVMNVNIMNTSKCLKELLAVQHLTFLLYHNDGENKILKIGHKKISKVKTNF